MVQSRFLHIDFESSQQGQVTIGWRSVVGAPLPSENLSWAPSLPHGSFARGGMGEALKWKLACSKIALATFSKVQENSQESEELEAENTSIDIIFPNHTKKQWLKAEGP